MEPHITVRTATTATEYLASIRWAVSARWRYVIYDPVGRSRLPAVLNCSDLPAIHWTDCPEQQPEVPENHADSQHIVLALTPDKWCLPAQYFAAARGAPLIHAYDGTMSSIQQAMAKYNPQYLTIVGHPHMFTGSLLADIMDVQCSADAPAMGILTHRSPEQLSELVVKNLLYHDVSVPGGSLTFAGVVASDLEIEQQGVKVLGKPQCQADELRSASPIPLRVLAILNHGRPDTVNLIDAKICGKNLSAHVDGVGGAGFFGYPACHWTDACHIPSELIPGEQVSAAFVVINSCFSLGLGCSLMDLNYGLTMSLLDGTAAACLSSPIMREGKCVETALILAAVRDGMTIGEAARLGARILTDTGLDHPSLLLIGDPELRLYPEGTGPVTADVTVDGNHVYIRGREQTSNLLEARLPDEICARSINKGAVQLILTGVLKHRQPLFWAAVNERDQGKLLISSWTPVDWSGLQLEVRPTALTHNQMGQRISSTYTALMSHAAMGINPPRAGGRLQQIGDAITNLASLYDSGWHDLRQQGLIRKREQALSDMLAALEQDALEHVLGRTDRRVFHFPDAYRHLCTVECIDRADVNCPQCDEQVLIYDLQHRLRREFRRKWWMCMRCGVVADYAVTEESRVALSLALVGPQLVAENKWQGTLLITNETSDEVRVYAGVRMIGGAWHDSVYEPERLELVISGGCTERVPVVISPAEVPAPHHRWLRAYAVSGGQIYSINRDIFFVPEGCDETG